MKRVRMMVKWSEIQAFKVVKDENDDEEQVEPYDFSIQTTIVPHNLDDDLPSFYIEKTLH
jgi:hypothetical protein